MDLVDGSTIIGLLGFAVALYTVIIKYKQELTKEKYQNLMAEKVDLYANLLKIDMQHNENILEVGYPDYEVDTVNKTVKEREILEYEIYISTYNKIKVNLEKSNLLLLSPKLEEIFYPIRLSYRKSELALNSNEVDRDPVPQYIIDKEVEEDFFENNRKEIDKFFTILKKEVKVLKKSIRL